MKFLIHRLFSVLNIIFVFMYVSCFESYIYIYISKNWNLYILKSVEQTAEIADTFPCYLWSMMVKFFQKSLEQDP